MDHVLCDYDEGFEAHQAKYPDLEFPQSEPGMYVNLEPLPGAIDAYQWLDSLPAVEVYILTSPSVRNPHCYAEKRIWVERYLGLGVAENLIISPHKHLNKGDFLIDDNAFGKGQERFEGELILFGSKDFPDWSSVLKYLDSKISEG